MWEKDRTKIKKVKEVQDRKREKENKRGREKEIKGEINVNKVTSKVQLYLLLDQRLSFRKENSASKQGWWSMSLDDDPDPRGKIKPTMSGQFLLRIRILEA